MLLSKSASSNDGGLFQLYADDIASSVIHLPFDQSISSAGFFVSQVQNLPTHFAVSIGYELDDGNVDQVLTGEISIDGTESILQLRGVGGGEDASGYIEFDSLPQGSRAPIGVFNFDPEDSRIHPITIQMAAKSLSGITVVDGDQQSKTLTGKVTLEAGENFALVIKDLAEGAVVVLDAVDGSGLVDECPCGDEAGVPITHINSIPAGENGNFDIITEKCLDQEQIANGLRVTNPCADPCCGCETAEQLTENVADINSRVDDNWKYMQRIQQQQRLIQLYIDRRQSNV